VDPARSAIYVGTGDATTAPPAKTTDAIMAIDINTGKLLWSYQATENDVFMGGCNGPTKSEACPTPMGPDMDIGNSPILTTLPNGKRALLAGTKSADVFALDPDNNGAVLFRMNAAGGPTTVREPRGLRPSAQRPANVRGSSSPKVAGSHSAQRRRSSPESCSRADRMAGYTQSLPPTANNSGSSTRRRSLKQ
jgi:glucose dehydrogenase